MSFRLQDVRAIPAHSILGHALLSSSLDQEEVMVTVHPESGRILGFDHTLPEDRPGADLRRRGRASDRRCLCRKLAASELSGMEMKESTSRKRKARRDHLLAWEARPGDPRNVDEAHYRVEIRWPATAFRSGVHSGSCWSGSCGRARRKVSGLSSLPLRASPHPPASPCSDWCSTRNIRSGVVRWKAAMAIGGAAAVLLTVSQSGKRSGAQKLFDL